MNRPRRILHLIDSYGPGGAETIFVQLATGLPREDWVSVASVPREGWVAQALRAQGLEPVLIPAHGRFNVGYLRGLINLIRREEVALLHSHLFGAAIYGGLAARICRIPIVSTLHGEPDLPGSRRTAAPRFAALNLTGNEMVLVSGALREAFHRQGRFPRDRSRVIYNGIDLETFAPGPGTRVRRELGVGPDDILIGAVGNFRPAKALDDFVRTARLLADRDDRYRFLIAGEPDDTIFPEVRTLRDELGLAGRLHFLGYREDVTEVLRALDMYASSSLQEGFSLTVIQAMAVGTPVVATRSGGPEEILTDGVTGLLVPPGVPAKLAAAVHQLWKDEPRRRRLKGRAQAAVSDRFRLGRMLAEYQDLYRALLE